MPHKVQDVVEPDPLADPSAPAINATKITNPDGMVVSMGSDLNTSIFNKSDTKLASTPGFNQVVTGGPADFAAYTNLATLIPMIPDNTPADAASLKPLNALGMTVTGGTVPTINFRISFK